MKVRAAPLAARPQPWAGAAAETPGFAAEAPGGVCTSSAAPPVLGAVGLLPGIAAGRRGPR